MTTGGTYAAKTEVPASKSYEEVKRTLQRFGASSFGYVETPGAVAIQFEVKGLRVLMRMALPDRAAFRLSETGRARPDSAIEREWEQATRQRWRTLANAIKAKLAMVDDGLSSVESEFLSNILTADGETVGEKIVPQIHEVARTAELPPMVPAGPRAKVIAIGSGR